MMLKFFNDWHSSSQTCFKVYCIFYQFQFKTASYFFLSPCENISEQNLKKKRRKK